jgi:hypothetical protein
MSIADQHCLVIYLFLQYMNIKSLTNIVPYSVYAMFVTSYYQEKRPNIEYTFHLLCNNYYTVRSYDVDDPLILRGAVANSVFANAF